jgi:hypothetical protein
LFRILVIGICLGFGVWDLMLHLTLSAMRYANLREEKDAYL